MLQTLLINLKLHFREKSQLFWLFAFPIILATMFNGMFGNIAESYELHTIDVVVVDNDAWRASPGAQTLVDGISSDADDDHKKADSDDGAMPKLITATKTSSVQAANQLLSVGKAQGALSVDGEGKLQLAISQATQSSVTDVMASSSGLDISLTVLGNIVDLYNRNNDVVVNTAQHNPSALLDDAFTGSIGSSSGFTKRNPVDEFQTEQHRTLLLRTAWHGCDDGHEFRRERGVDGTGESFGAWHPTFRRSLAEIAAVACRFPCQLDLLVPESDRSHAVHPFRLSDLPWRP